MAGAAAAWLCLILALASYWCPFRCQGSRAAAAGTVIAIIKLPCSLEELFLARAAVVAAAAATAAAAISNRTNVVQRGKKCYAKICTSHVKLTHDCVCVCVCVCEWVCRTQSHSHFDSTCQTLPFLLSLIIV